MNLVYVILVTNIRWGTPTYTVVQKVKVVDLTGVWNIRVRDDIPFGDLPSKWTPVYFIRKRPWSVVTNPTLFDSGRVESWDPRK